MTSVRCAGLLSESASCGGGHRDCMQVGDSSVGQLRTRSPGFTASPKRRNLRQVFLSSEVRFAVLCASLALIPLDPARAMDRAPQVRLLFPVLTGEELAQLLPLAPQATLVQINGSSYVLVAEFPDARVAHRLGRTIQRRLRIPFDLAYDPGHPQVDLASQQPIQSVAAAASALEPDLQPASPWPPGPGAAALMEGGPLRLALSGSVDASPQPASPAPPIPATPTPWMAETGLVLPLRREEAGSPQSVNVSSGSQDRSGRDTAVAAEDLPAGQQLRPQLPALKASGTQPNRPALRGLTLPAEGGASRHPWLRGVAIQPVAVAPPVSRLMPASNPDVNYLFVRLKDAQQVTALQQIIPVAELNLHQGRLLARVGVFTRSIRGQLMLEQRLNQLRRYSLQLLVARGELPGAPRLEQLEAG